MTGQIKNPELNFEFQPAPLPLVRQQLVTGILVALSIIGLPVTIIACIEADKLGQDSGILLYGMFYLLIVATTLLSRRLSFNLCAVLMLTSLYLISIFNLLHFSFSGAGIELGITISALATVLFGTRNGLIAAAIFLVSLLAIGLGFLTGVLEVSPDMPATTMQMVSWLTAAAAFVLFSGTLVLGSGMLQGHLIRALSSLQCNADKLEKANTDLTLEIKHRKKTEVKLVQSEKQFKTLFELAPDAIYLSDPEGRFLDANRTAEALIGKPKTAFIGKKISEAGILPENEIPKALRILEKNMQGKRTGPDEITFINKDNGSIVVEISTNPFQLGERSVILGIARDVSQRKRLERHLRQAQKMEAIGALAGGIAHDFNNILSSILGFTELALEDLPGDSVTKNNLEEVYAAGYRAKELVQQILAFARQSEEDVKPIQPSSIIKEVLKLIRSSIPATIEIKQNIRSDAVIMGNATQLHSIIMNLCTNASQSMEEDGGILKVTLKEEVIDDKPHMTHPGLPRGLYLSLKVTDTGRGIAPEIIGSIFDPYFTTKAAGKGTGMGLAMVQGIVEGYGGKITVDSIPGSGSTFTVYFPVIQKQQIQRRKNSSQLLMGDERILFVDDEAPIARLGSQGLERLGYQVTTRTSSIEALELFRSKPDSFDLVITDMTMPNMTGDKLAVELMNVRADIPVILCSGYNKNMSAEIALKTGIKAFACKPLIKAELAKTVRNVLDTAKPENLNNGHGPP